MNLREHHRAYNIVSIIPAEVSVLNPLSSNTEYYPVGGTVVSMPDGTLSNCDTSTAAHLSNTLVGLKSAKCVCG
jgi:hypothetical protein